MTSIEQVGALGESRSSIQSSEPNDAILLVDPLQRGATRSAIQQMGLSYRSIGNTMLVVEGGSAFLGRLSQLAGVESAEADRMNTTQG